ncbi:MAG: hypothetical protein HY776_07180 [Actinobacteria bacterium]|nr:hypothetical protein [Actinomycetota bacterium]
MVYDKKIMQYQKLKRARRRKFQTRLIVLLLVLFFMVYYIGGGFCSRNKERELRAYINKVNQLVDESNKVAEEFNRLKAGGGISRNILGERLLQYSKEIDGVNKKSKNVDPPQLMIEAHKYLEIVFELRADALKRYKPALFDALTDQDLEVASSQVSSVLKDLSLSDRAYIFFSDKVRLVLDNEEIKDTFPVESKFLKEDNVYEKTSVLSYLFQLKGIKSLQESHGLGVISFSVSPKEIRYVPKKKLYVLPKTDFVSVAVTFQNQGNQIEKNFFVKTTLKSENKTKEQTEETVVDTILPEEKKTVLLKGLKPAGGGTVNLLTISVGPVPNEKNLDNNAREYKFIVE